MPSGASSVAERASAPPLIEVDDLTIRYRGSARPALSHLAFSVRAGERILVLGPTGSGKSTLALALNGIIPQSLRAEMQGSVRIAGMDSIDTPLGRISRVAATVFQDPESQFCMARVDEEIAFGLENLNVVPAEIDRRVRAALGLVGATELASHRLDRLSGGQKQRVALAAGLAVEPRVLVLDEPTANLDPRGALEFFELLRRVPALETTAVTIIEHRLEGLVESVDRALVLDEFGRLLADGRLDHVMAVHGAQLAAGGVWIPEGVELALAGGLACGDEVPLTVAAALRRPEIEAFVREWTATRARRPASRGEPALRAQGLTLGYGSGAVVCDADLAVRRGEIAALVGPNGSGKTTLLLGLAGLLDPLAGRVTAADVGMVFQNPEHQFVTTNVYDEIAYGLRVRACPETVIASRAEAALDRFGLGPLEARNPFQLSWGEKRRLSLVAMAVTEPAVLLLDEPTFGQDRAHALALMDALRALADLGSAVVLTTHDMRLVAAYADRVLVMDHGRLGADCTPETLFADDALLERASLVRPALVQWWLDHDDLDLRSLMNAARLGPNRVGIAR